MKENFEYSEDEKGNYLQVELERFSILYYFHPKSITVYYFDGWEIEDEVYAKQIVREKIREKKKNTKQLELIKG